MNKERELSTGKIGTLMGHYAVPCILSLLVGALYNIVDQIFIANASYLGSYGNAAKSGVFVLNKKHPVVIQLLTGRFLEFYQQIRYRKPAPLLPGGIHHDPPPV